MPEFKELVQNLYTSKNRELTPEKLDYIQKTYAGKEQEFVKNFYSTIGEELTESKFNYINDTYLKKKEQSVPTEKPSQVSAKGSQLVSTEKAVPATSELGVGEEAPIVPLWKMTGKQPLAIESTFLKPTTKINVEQQQQIKKTQDKALNNTVKARLKAKGIIPNENDAIYKKELDAVNKDIKDGNLAITKNSKGDVVLGRRTGLLESGGDAFVHSVKEHAFAAKANTITNPRELANYFNELETKEPELPKVAAGLGGYVGELVGGLPKMVGVMAAGTAATGGNPIGGIAAIGAEAQWLGMANKRRELYNNRKAELLRNGVPQDEAEFQAADAAMKDAPLAAIPNTATNIFLVSMGGAKATPELSASRKAFANTIKATENTVKKTATQEIKDIASKAAKVGTAGALSPIAEYGIEKAQGYDVKIGDALDKTAKGFADFALMDLAFHTLLSPKKFTKTAFSAAKEFLSNVPSEVITEQIQKYGNNAPAILSQLESYKKAKGKVADYIPQDVMHNVTGLQEAIDNKTVKLNELKKEENIPTSIIDSQQKEIDALKQKQTKIIETGKGNENETDDLTGGKIIEPITIADKRQEQYDVLADLATKRPEFKFTETFEEFNKNIDANPNYLSEVYDKSAPYVTTGELKEIGGTKEAFINYLTEKPTEVKPEIILSGLNEGFKAVSYSGFDVRSSPEVMNHINNQNSFAEVIDYKGKKYAVVGLRLETARPEKTIGRDNYSFAVVEINETTPKNIIETLENSAKENFKDIYKDFNNKDVVKPITVKNPELKTLETKPTEVTTTPVTTTEVKTATENKSDADIENRLTEIQDKGAKSTIEEDKEFDILEKEMEKRERNSVFNVPLEKVNDAVDVLMKKEKEMPNGWGSFIEKRDARKTKEVADKYNNPKDISDAELKTDFKEALMGNPKTSYADGLKLRESMKEAANRGIDINDMLKVVESEFTKDGYDADFAKEMVSYYLKPIFEGSTKATTEVKPIGALPTKEKIFTYDKDGNIIQAEILSKGKDTTSILIDGNQTVRANTELFANKEDAQKRIEAEAGSVGVGGDVIATTQALKKLDDNGELNKIFIEKEISIDDIAEESADGQKLSDAIVNVKDGLKSQTKGKILVYESGGKYYIADGFHRVAEAKLKGDKSIQADVVYAKPKDIAEAYHKAKADGTNLELVKAVEQSLKETPKAEAIQPEVKITIDSESLKKNTQPEIDRVKTLPLENEDGATFNLDGTKHEGGLVVPVESLNTTRAELTPELINDFVEKNKDKISGDNFKVGIYKFPNSENVSIDLNIVVDPKFKDAAIEFGKLAGQESLFDLDSFQNVKTGATGENPKSFTPKEFFDIAKSLAKGEVPEVVKATEAKPTEIKAEPKTVADTVADDLFTHLGIEPEGTEATAPRVYTSENVSELTSEGLEGDQKAVIDSVKNIVAAIDKLVEATTGNKLKVSIYDNQASFTKGVEEYGGSKQDSISKGFYMSEDGTIHINMSRASSETMLHEGFHPVLDYLAANKPEIIDNFHKQLSKLKGGDKIIADAERAYKGMGDTTIKKEAITDFIAKIADPNNPLQLDKTNFEKVKAFVLDMLEKMGLKFDKDIRTIDDLKKLAQVISKKFQKGEEVKIFKGINEPDIKNGDIVASGIIPSNLKEDTNVKPKQFSKDEETELKREGILKYLKFGNLSDISNEYMTTTMSDRAVAGDLSYKNGKAYLKKGGALYPLLMKKLGLNRVWASMEKSKLNTLINNLKTDKDGYAYIGIMSMGKQSHMSNIDAFNFVFDTIDIELKDRKSTLTKQMFLDAINQAYEKKYATGKSIADAVGKPKLNKNMSIAEIKNAVLENISHSDAAFDIRRNFLESLLGNAEKKEGRLGQVPNYKKMAALLEEPLVRDSKNGDVVAYMKVKKEDLSVIKTNSDENGHHNSYPYAIESKSPVDYVFLNSPVHVSDIYPEFINKSGNKVSYEDAKVKYGEEKAMRTHTRNVILSAPSEKVPQWSKGQDLIESTGKRKEMTEDDKGNYLFFHYSDKKFNKLSPEKVGKHLATGRDERTSVPTSSLYTRPDRLETNVPSDFGYITRVPKEKVYSFTADPLNLMAEAEARFKKENKDRAFDANNQFAYVAKIAAEKGFPVTVADWNIKGTKALIAKTTEALPLEKYTNIKAGTTNQIEFAKGTEDIKPNAKRRDIQFQKEQPIEVNWEESLEGKGDPTISARNPIVQEAAANLKAGKITNEEYRAIASENNPIRPITRFFEPATEDRIKTALSEDKKDKINIPVENNKEVGLRLDIPAYKNNNTWVVSIHEGTTNAGKAISYTNVAKIKDVNFGVEPKAALAIASGVPKTTIGRMFGKWENIEGNTLQQKGENAKKIVEKIANDPDWVQVGMNPFRHSYFYDRSSDIGRPIKSAEEVIQVGGLVYAKKPVYGEWTDEAYTVKGLFDAAGKAIQFQKEGQDAKIKDFIEMQREKGISDEDIKAGLEKAADRIGLDKNKIDELLTTKKEGNAIQKPSPEGVLQPTQEGAGEAGGKRTGMEQAEQGNVPPKEGKPGEAEVGGDEEEAVSGLTKAELSKYDSAKTLFESEGKTTWNEVVDNAVKKLIKDNPNTTVEKAAQNHVDRLSSLYDEGRAVNPTAEDLAVIALAKLNVEKQLSDSSFDLNSDDISERNLAVAEFDRLNQELIKIAKATNPREAGLAFGIRQMLLSTKNGLEIRRMELMKNKGGEKLTDAEMTFTREQWAKEKKLMQEQSELKEKKMQEDFDAALKLKEKEYQDLLAKRGAVEVSAAKAKSRQEVLKQKGKDLADKLRSNKQSGFYSDPFLVGKTLNFVLDTVADLVEAGADLASAIDKFVSDNRIQSRRKMVEDAIFDHLNRQEKRSKAIDAINEIAADTEAKTITKDMVLKNAIKDFVDSYVNTVELNQVSDVAFKKLKELLPNITKEQFKQAYLKVGEFKIEKSNELKNQATEQQRVFNRMTNLENQLAELKKKNDLLKDGDSKKEAVQAEIQKINQKIQSELTASGRKVSSTSSLAKEGYEKRSNEHDKNIDEVVKDLTKQAEGLTGKEKDLVDEFLGKLNDSKIDYDPASKLNQSSKVENATEKIDLLEKQLDVLKKSIDKDLAYQMEMGLQKIKDRFNSTKEEVNQSVMLEQAKKDALNRKKEFERKIIAKEFDDTVPKKTLTKTDAELIENQAQLATVKSAYDKLAEKYRREKRTALEVVLETGKSIALNTLIGMPKTFFKLAVASPAKIIQTYLSKAIFGKLAELSFNKGIIQRAKEGGESSSFQAMNEGLKQVFSHKTVAELEKNSEKDAIKYTDSATKYENAIAETKRILDEKGENSKEYKNALEKQEKLRIQSQAALKQSVGNTIGQYIGGSTLGTMWEKLVKRNSQYEKAFGDFNSEEWTKINNWKHVADNVSYIFGLVGRSHGALKSISARYHFGVGFMARLEAALEKGEDITDFQKLKEIASDSYTDWESGMYQQENWVTGKTNKIIDYFKRSDVKAARVIGNLASWDVAITKVPVNMINESIIEMTLGLPISLTKYTREYIKASKIAKAEVPLRLTEAQKADYRAALQDTLSKMDKRTAVAIVRCFRHGGFGLGIMALAVASGAVNFGGFPHLGQKKEDEKKGADELKTAEIELGNTKLNEYISGALEHTTSLFPTLTYLAMQNDWAKGKGKGLKTYENVSNLTVNQLEHIVNSYPQSKIFNPVTVSKEIYKMYSKAGKKAVEEYSGGIIKFEEEMKRKGSGKGKGKGGGKRGSGKKG